MDQERSIHYTDRERLLLAQLVSEESVIDCKRTGAVDLKEKADAWERITRKFISEGCTPRNSKQLRKCWDNLKQKKRKLTTVMKHQRLMTGRGPAPVQRVDPVMDFIDAATENVDVEINCPFDSTAAFEREYNYYINTQLLPFCYGARKKHFFTFTDNIGSSCSTSKSLPQHSEDQDEDIYNETDDVSYLEDHSLRPNSSHPAASTKKRGTSSHQSLENIRCEKELRLIRLREAIEQQRELHAKKMKIAEAEEKLAILKVIKQEEDLRRGWNLELEKSEI